MSIAENLSPETLAQQAQHEWGHAAASWALGIPFLRILLRGPQGLPIVEPLRGNRVLVEQHWLIQCCGAIADQQRRGLRMRNSQIVKLVLGGGSDDFFEIDDAATGQIVLNISRMPAVRPGGDLNHLAMTLPVDSPNPVAECIKIWRGSEMLAAAI